MNNSNVAAIKDPVVLRKMGIDVLTRSLGPVGMTNFIRQFDSGSGDYTKERQTFFEELTVDEICKEIRVGKLK